GDCVQVAPGVYSNINVSVPNVYFIATGSPSETVIDGNFGASCVRSDLLDWSVYFEGFTLVNGTGVYAEVDVPQEDGTTIPFDGYFGGGAFGVSLVRCVVSNCTAAVGGGTYNCNHFSCLITGNAAMGDGAYAGGVSLGFLSGCTVTDNSADSYCGGIDRDTFAKNSIVWGNYVADGTCPDFEDAEAGTALLWYTCTSAAPTYGQDDEENASVGVLVADPRFVDAEKGDYRLRASSPCLDLGSVEFSDVDICELDLAGNDRIQNGAPDQGAYEGGVEGCVLRLASSPEVWYSGLAQEGEVAIAGDLDWTATIDAAWVTGVTAAGSGDATVTYALSANAASTARTAHLVVTEASGVAVTQTIHQATQALPPSAAATTYGLFVGVDTYAIPGVSQLSGAVADAVNMRERFTRWGYCRAANAVLLTNALATVTAVRQALTNLAATVKVGDVVVYYQAGHGKQISDNDVAIVEHDALYSDAELAADLSRFTAGVKVVVMADTCHSGGLFREAVSGATFDLAARVRARMSEVRPVVRPTARAVARPIGVQATSAAIGSEDIGWLTAADVDEYSWEDLGGGGLFTVACLAGWQSGAADIDGDERVSFYELWRYAKEAAAARGTTAQCQNEAILCSVFAGVTDAATCETETYSTPVRVPFVWLDTYMAAWGYVPQANAAYSFADYAAAAERTKTTSWGKTIAVWQDYVAGTDPTKSDDVFRATIEIVDGKPDPSWSPRLSAAEEAKRIYRKFGKGALTESWGEVTPDSRFFKVAVEMR
ncbi:MAG: caspase family protein, partial [Kiritimatiellae bacterium]|nr:caspase family protein [Kiritimatiellia bacterium]